METWDPSLVWLYDWLARVAQKAPCGCPPRLSCKLVISHSRAKETGMSKGMDRKKEDKKKPAKTLEEKRAAKRDKKARR